jgi:hypothetical protein
MPNLIDLPPCTGSWTFQDTSTYAKLDYYLHKNMTRVLPYYQTFAKLFKTWNWEPKQGNKTRGVRKEASPINRSMFYPAQRTLAAKVDQIALRESQEEAILYHHKVESELLYYEADFANFLDNHKEVGADITRKIAMYPELFYRSALWDMAPRVYVCGYGWVTTPAASNGFYGGNTKNAGTLLNLFTKAT